MVRFLVTQASGKERAIDNAKRAGHNRFSKFLETIFTISADWIAEASAQVRSELVEADLAESESLDDFGLEVATEDSPDAYRGCPAKPEEYGSSVLAVWDPVGGEYVFFILKGLAYGLASAVLSFSRLPVLIVAALRRSFACVTAAYFDDLPLIDLHVGRGTGRAALGSAWGDRRSSRSGKGLRRSSV